MRLCPERVKAVDGRLPSLIQNHVTLVDYYDKCRLRHNELVDYIRKSNSK